MFLHHRPSPRPIQRSGWSPRHATISGVRTRTVAPYAAYLRVYEPLAAYTGAERERWQAYVADSAHPDRRAVVAREQAAALARAVRTPPVPAPALESEDAYVLMAGGTVQICPVQERLRCWLAFEDLQDVLPEPVIDVVVPPAAAKEVEERLAEWRGDQPGASHILTATWHVPPRWFVPFAPGERSLTLGAGTRSLVYRTRMVEARRRVARTARALRKAGVEAAVTEPIEDLGRWLEEFHPRGYVELDYAGLVECISDEDLRADDSARDVAAAVAALATGDAAAASAAYRRVIDRWERVQARGRAS